MIAADIACAVSVLGLAQACAGWIAVAWFADRVARARCGHPRAGSALPAVTILKPLHGDEPLLEQALTTTFQQDYPTFQIVFGVSAASDTALPSVKRLRARFPTMDIAIVVDPTLHGENRKVGNLINMLPAAKHDVLVIADSDVHVMPDWLRRLVDSLDEPQVGLVTAAYTGIAARRRARPNRGVGGRVSPVPAPASLPDNGGWLATVIGALGSVQINQYFLPGALIARAMGRQDCLGATMMLRRDTLERIGGFHALVDRLADDNVLGRLVQRLGLRVALASTIPATTVPEATAGSLWRHELRWARTIRTLTPVPFAASVLQYPLAWAALTILLAGGALWSLVWFALAWALRALAAHGIDKALALANRSPLWLLPVRELMSVAVMVASYAGRRVDWRGHTLQAEGFNAR
jgi:ceramide glucosyltransferase